MAKKTAPISPAIPTGLVSVKAWSAANGLSQVCLSRWSKAGKIALYRVPGHGIKNFVKKVEADALLGPKRVLPALAR